MKENIHMDYFNDSRASSPEVILEIRGGLRPK